MSSDRIPKNIFKYQEKGKGSFGRWKGFYNLCCVIGLNGLSNDSMITPNYLYYGTFLCKTDKIGLRRSEKQELYLRHADQY
jgi:hypothetical protein